MSQAEVLSSTSPITPADLPGLEVNGHSYVTSPSVSPTTQVALDKAYEASSRSVEYTKTENKLNDFVDRVSQPISSGYYVTASEFYNNNADAIQDSMANAVRSPDMKAAEKDIRSFAESSKVLMKMLDEVAKVHPFIGVAVLVFKAVVTLGLKKRDNDSKIIALKVKMQDMMSILLELRYVRDPRQEFPNGTTLEGRMQGLMKAVAKDIADCGCLCDTYAKKSLVAKVFKGPIWDDRLAGFVDIFANRRKEIEFALSIHNTLGIDNANRTLSELREGLHAVHEKLDMLDIFKRLDRTSTKELTKIVADAKGPPDAWIDNDDVLRKLILATRNKAKDIQPTAPATAIKSPKSAGVKSSELATVRAELQEDPDQALARNIELFDRKMKVQEKQLMEQLGGVVHREGDRIISAVISGPHDRLMDPDLHKLWKEMGWKGSAKARHFVLALYDYFVDKYRETDDQHVIATPVAAMSPFPSDDHPDPGMMIDIALTTYHPNSKSDDRWALTYINISRIQPILESFDVDGSGFININEANSLTSSRPKGWSLPHWLAYWAAGWHSVTWGYALGIKRVIQTMYDHLEDVLPANRSMVDQYLECIFRVEQLCSSVRACDEHVYYDPLLNEKISPYIMEEQQRIEENLKSIAYHIDAPNTLTLIVGQGPIERYIFPLLYLLLKQHIRIIKLACKGIFSENHLTEAEGSLEHVFSYVYVRINNLVAHFKHKGFDIMAQLENVAFGMFRLLTDDAAIELDEDRDSSYDSDSEDVSDDVDPGILKLGLLEHEADWSKYEDPDFEIDGGEGILASGQPSLQGIWTGTYSRGEAHEEDSFYVTLRSGQEGGSFVGDGADGSDSFKVVGHLDACKDEAGYDVRFTKDAIKSGTPSTIFQGKLYTATTTIDGHWGVVGDEVLGEFHLALCPPFARQFRYSSQEYRYNRARARWQFAGAATLHRIRRSFWSWSFFKGRMEKRKRFIELWKRRELAQAWSHTTFNDVDLEKEALELTELEETLSPADLVFFQSLAKSDVRTEVVHCGLLCDSCGTTMIGTRLICLECVAPNFGNQVDLCFSCLSMEVMNENFTHEKAHPMVKLQRFWHRRELGALVRRSREAVERANDALQPMSERKVTPADATPSDSEVGSGTEGEVDESADDQDAGVAKTQDGGSTASDKPLDESFDRRCINCQELISRPCWYCIDCDTGVFICDDCDARNIGHWGEGHCSDHPLVRCQEQMDAPAGADQAEARISEIENKITVLNERLVTLETRMDDLHTALNQRFSTMEELLKQVICRLTSHSPYLVEQA